MIEVPSLSNAITSTSIVTTNIQAKRSSRLRSASLCKILSSEAALSSTFVGRDLSAIAVKSSDVCDGAGVVLGDDVCVGDDD